MTRILRNRDGLLRWSSSSTFVVLLWCSVLVAMSKGESGFDRRRVLGEVAEPLKNDGKLRRRKQFVHGGPAERIVNGTVVSDPTRYPYAAALYELARTADLKCGAVLVAADILLTAAHCSGFYNYVELDRFNVFASNFEGYERFVIDRVVDHPQSFKADDVSPRRFDVALIKVFGYAFSVSPVSIAGIGGAADDLVSGQPLTVVGWGFTENPFDSTKNARLSAELREVELNYLTNEQCRQAAGPITNSTGGIIEDYTYDGRIFDEMMCVLTPFRDSCVGDSGGPLILNGGSPEADAVMGVVSFGIGCASRVFPGVYARLSEMTDWLRETVCNMTAYEAPPEFQCAEAKSPPPPIFPPGTTSVVQEEGDGLVDISLQIQLDFASFETGWLLESVTSGIVYRYAPIFSYREETDQFLIFETIRGLPAQDEYVLRIIDASGNGLGQFTQGYFTIYQGVVVNDVTAEAGGATVLVDQAALGRWAEFNFETGLLPRQFTYDVFFTPVNPANQQDEGDCLDQDDDEAAEFRVYLSNVAGKKRNCRWLASCHDRKRSYYCDTFRKARSLCRVTCGNKCNPDQNPQCKDRKKGVFPFHPRKTRTCGWLQDRVGPTRRNEICQQSTNYLPSSAMGAAEACPLTCGVRRKCQTRL